MSNTAALNRRTLRNYLLLCGAGAHLLLVAGLLGVALLFPDHSLGQVLKKAQQRLSGNHPTIAGVIGGTLAVTGLGAQREIEHQQLPAFPGPSAWPGQGPRRAGFDWIGYDQHGVPQQAAAGRSINRSDHRIVDVGDTQALLAALKKARPGDVITLSPGTYRIAKRRLGLGAGGLPGKPIYVTAAQFGDVEIQLDSLEGFFVDQPYWVFENLKIRGVCSSDSRCEHAFHVVGRAIGTTLRNNEITDFNAALKVNGLFGGKTPRFPDFGLVHNNAIYNTRARRTANPVSLLNINAANGWVVSANFIADFAKATGNRVSYGAYMKSNSRDGVFERNLVVCHWRVPPAGDTRVGLSFGGGGSDPRFCRDGSNRVEHSAGMIRNNIVARCPDVGIYLNKSAHTQVQHNLLSATRGIDVRFASSSASIHNNVMDGRIRDRDGGLHNADNNLVADQCGWLDRLLGDCGTGDWYEAPLGGGFRVVGIDSLLGRGNTDPRGEPDFCGNPRAAPSDIGPIQYGAGPLCLPDIRSAVQ